MALNYTEAGLEAKLDEVADHVEASAWAEARRDLVLAELIRSRLSEERKIGSALSKRHASRTSELLELIEKAEAATGDDAEHSRFIRTRLGGGAW